MAIDRVKKARTESKAEGASGPDRQSIKAYQDYRTVDPNIFLQETYDGTGAFRDVRKKVTSYPI